MAGTPTPSKGSPGEGFRSELDGAIVLNDAEQLQPTGQTGRAAPFAVALRDELRIVDHGLASVRRMRWQGE
jgi:hypothetical protein